MTQDDLKRKVRWASVQFMRRVRRAVTREIRRRRQPQRVLVREHWRTLPKR